MKSSSLLAELQDVAARYGRGLPARKRSLLAELDDMTLSSAREVHALHEVLLLLCAYPDDARVLEQVDGMLEHFAGRGDLRRFAEELADSGIAGTPNHYRFYWGMAQWIVQRWPQRLSIDWAEVDTEQAIERVLQLLVLHTETPALDTMVFAPKEWIERLKGPHETDAAFLIRRIARLEMPESVRELLYDGLDIPMRLEPGPGGPSRTHAWLRLWPTVFQKRARRRRRPSLKREAAIAPIAVERASHAQGARLVDLAREAMLTRQRDLSGIDWADPKDAHLIDAGDGLAFGSLGLPPERRLMLESVYVFLIFKNGVLVGYFQAATLFGASELNYNLFAPWRGAEAAVIYARGVAMVHHLLGSDVFVVDPYQLGDGNREAIRTGAFWFYHKLGFRPEDAARRRIVRRERAAMQRDPTHRSSPATLRKLCGDYLFLYLGEPRDDVIGKIHYGEIGLAVSRYVACRFGSDREAAVATCSAEAVVRLGLDSLDGFSKDELVAWQRWSPIVMLLEEIEHWPARAKRALVAVIRAKGGRPERDYVRRFDRHARLRTALARLGGVGE